MTYTLQDFSGKTVLITGATSGIGKACALAFVEAGAHVLAVGRRKVLLQELAQDFPRQITPIALDVTDKNAIEQAFGGLTVDVLVNNAGLALGMERADQAKSSDWARMIETNINGVLHMTHTILPMMVQKDKGHIINIGSIAGSYAYPGGNVYGATKAFIKQFSLNLRADLIGTPIRVTNIEPGMVETDFSLIRFKGDAEKAEGVYANTQPLTPEDIAQSVFWAASLPEHVNINRIEVMPVSQAPAALAVSRKGS